MQKNVRDLFKLALLYAVASVAGYLFSLLGVPLPWMIGPLILTGVLTFAGLNSVAVPVRTRPFGQLVIASQVALYFTPEAFAMVADHAVLLVSMALMIFAIALFVAVLLSRLARIELTQAILSSLPTSPVEAAIMAEHHGHNPALVILSQVVRNAIVVVTIPITIYYLDGAAGRAVRPVSMVFDPILHPALLLVSVAGAAAFKRLRLANPFFLGPLAVVAALNVAGVHFEIYPSWLLWGAQVVLGTWLGSTFRRSLFSSAGRFVGAVLFCSVLFIVLCTATAAALSVPLGLPWDTMVLSAAPGGVTEMALTAKVLNAEVALVTAFHLTRIFLIVPNIAWFVRLVERVQARRGRGG